MNERVVRCITLSNILYPEANALVKRIGLQVAPVMLPERAAVHHSVAEAWTHFVAQ